MTYFRSSQQISPVYKRPPAEDVELVAKKTGKISRKTIRTGNFISIWLSVMGVISLGMFYELSPRLICSCSDVGHLFIASIISHLD